MVQKSHTTGRKNRAFRGELADPNDEPAADILKRILDEKSKLESGKKLRSKRSGKTALLLLESELFTKFRNRKK